MINAYAKDILRTIKNNSKRFIAGIISFSFTLIVNLITNRMLNKINMIEALKSVE